MRNNNNTNSSVRSRAIYRATEEYLKKNNAGEDLIISPSYLRAEQALNNSKSKYSFDLKKTGNEVATEVKLDRNDLFVVDRMALFLAIQLAASVGKEVVQSYPNVTVFTAVGLVPADLEAIYNGFTSLKIGNRVNIENLSNQEFRYVPDTQQASATTKSSYNADDAMYAPAPMIRLHGTMDIVLTVEFPSYAGIALQPTDQVANGTVKLVFILVGFLVKGGASKK